MLSIEHGMLLLWFHYLKNAEEYRNKRAESEAVGERGGDEFPIHNAVLLRALLVDCNH